MRWPSRSMPVVLAGALLAGAASATGGVFITDTQTDRLHVYALPSSR